MNITAILLAAGESKRFGRNKLAEPFLGKTIFDHAFDKLQSIKEFHEIIIAVNPGFSLEAEGNNVKIAINPDYQQGMGTSVREAVKASSKDTDAYLISLADMPLVKEETIASLIEYYKTSGNKICIPVFYTQKGHPVIMSAEFRDDILRLEKDKGARDIIHAHQDGIGYFETKDEGILFDIDTVENIGE